MKWIYGLFQHACSVMKLSHDGSGLPTQFSSALLMVSVYSLLELANHIQAGTVDLSLFFSIVFVVCVYTLVLRNALTGLIVLIGIVSNALSLVLGAFGTLTDVQIVMMALIEYILVFGALINVIKHNFKLH